ncbi:MAG: M48 family metallopeptidase, partial [Pseudomonadales bacterium]
SAEAAYISHMPATAYEVVSKLGSAPRVITFPGGAVFTTPDHAGIDELLDRTGRGFGQRLLVRLEASLPMALTAALVTAILAWVTVIYGVPALAKSVAFMLPAGVERNIGRGTLQTLDQVYFEPSTLDPAVTEHLRRVFEPVLSQYTELEPQLVFRQSDIGANAFALPSGIILFTDDLVNIAANDEQLLSVLYHEIGHLHHRHILRRSLQGSFLTVLAVLITGDVSGINEIVAVIPALLIDASYSRDFEREADLFAVTEMDAAGLDPRLLGEMLALIEASYEDTGQVPLMDFLRTHPGTKQRLQAISNE